MASISVCVRMRPYLAQERGEKGERQRILLDEEMKHLK